MKKIYIVLCFVVLLLVSFLGITYSYEYNENTSLRFELIGDYILDLSLDDEYIEYGVKVIYNGNDISSLVNIDNSMVDMNSVGEYKVKYEVVLDDMVEYIYRIVKVTENVKPVIKLKGDEVVYIPINSDYIEPGFDVFDNYDKDIYNNVVTTSNLNVTKKGEYIIEYKVIDSSGNESVVKRTVIVK